MSAQRPRTVSVQGSRQLELPKHISFSARETLLRCARSYFLKYLAKAPERPSLWLAGGSAVHETTEHYDRMALVGQEGAFNLGFAWERLFGAQLDKLRAKEPNENSWQRSPSEPIETWDQIGPQFVQSWIDWRQRSPYKIWTTPDGVPGIELDVSGTLPGCPVPIRGALDRVMEDTVFDQLIIVDIKTSKRPPKNADQFGVYAALLEKKYGVRAKLGVPFMNRRASLGTPHELDEYTPKFVGKLFGEAWAQIERGEFPADDSDCFLCGVSAACHIKNGPLAPTYDPASPGYAPPF